MLRALLVVGVACSSASKPIATPSAGNYLTVVGIKTYYEIHGAGPPLLVLHGGSGGIESFGPQIERFSTDFKVYAPERMGHGRTPDVVDKPFRFHDMAEHMVAFMDAMGVQKFDVLGWSDGAYVGLDIAIHHPDRIRRIAITGSSYRVDDAPEVIKWLASVKPEDWVDWIRDEYKRLSPDGYAHWPIFFERLRKMWLSATSLTVDQLKALGMPVLVMSGNGDVPLDSLATMLTTIPNAQLAVYPGATHLWPKTHADQFHAIVHRFLTAPDKEVEAPPPPSRPATGKHVTVHGLDMYYEDVGAGSPLILLHGGFLGSEPMGAQIDFFAKHNRVLAPDRMGHGHTADDPKRAFHYHDMAEDIVAFMDAVGVPQADMIGWSDGGIIGLDLALHHPDRIHKLAITGANFTVDGMNPGVIEWLRTTKPTEFLPWAIAAYGRTSPDGAAHWPQFFDRLRTMALVEPAYTVQQLRSITTPTLVMAGDHDIIRIDHTFALAKAIPNAEVCVYPAAGHGWPMEDADAFNRIVAEFLR